MILPVLFFTKAYPYNCKGMDPSMDHCNRLVLWEIAVSSCSEVRGRQPVKSRLTLRCARACHTCTLPCARHNPHDAADFWTGIWDFATKNACLVGVGRFSAAAVPSSTPPRAGGDGKLAVFEGGGYFSSTAPAGNSATPTCNSHAKEVVCASRLCRLGHW